MTDEKRQARRIYMRDWRSRNAGAGRWKDLKYKYGITKTEYERLWNDQHGLCAICSKTAPLCVDHCHKTGSIRGLLCGKCNVGLGRFQDSSHFLRTAAEYLDRSREA